jgi:excisionase family DNA binding protein
MPKTQPGVTDRKSGGADPKVRWLTFKEAEQEFKVSRWTLWRAVRDGRIRSIKIGRATRLDASSIAHA